MSDRGLPGRRRVWVCVRVDWGVRLKAKSAGILWVVLALRMGYEGEGRTYPSQVTIMIS